MNLRTFSTPALFLDCVGPTLLDREAESSLLLGIALRLVGGHSYGDEAPFLACVEDESRCPVVALRTPPYNLALCGDAARLDAIALVADHLAHVGCSLPGVHGRIDLTDSFGRRWQALTGAVPRIFQAQRLYRLTEVATSASAAGRPRWAESEDAALLATWVEAFRTEALADGPKSDARAMVDRAIANQVLLVWDDGGMASMCARTRPTPNSASVGLVYTPPDRRRRGYASACVAELSRRILDSGKTFCTLFTDLANPTSNAIYQRIGYVPVCDCDEIHFAPDPARARPATQ